MRRTPPTTSTSTPTTCASWSRRSRRSSSSTPGARSRRTRVSRWTSPCVPCSTRGTPTRAVIYRRQERIPADLGTAVNICSMVFGNLGMDSGTGRGLHPRPGQRCAGHLRRLPAERAGRGRRRRHPQHGSAGRSGEARQALLRRAAADHADARGALPRPVRHRVHHRARQAVDAADPGRQAHRGGGLPHRDPAGRPGPDRHGRGRVAGDRGAAGPADVPALRRERGRPQADRQGHERLAGCGGRQGRLRLLHRGQVVAVG